MSLTISAVRWANPEQSRAIVTTEERGAVLMKPERGDDWAALQAWIAKGNAPQAFDPPVENPGDALVRKLRGVVEDLPPDQVSGDGALALRLVLEVAKELVSRGAPAESSARFRALMERIETAERSA